jgi:N-methylhydantoinase A
MIAFGGAAPLHAGRLCEKLGIERLLVPVGAGVGSAIGFLRAPFSFEANRSVYMRLSEFDPGLIKSLLAELRAEATNFVRSCDAGANIESEYKVYMRYSGQGWEIPIFLSSEQANSPDADTFKQLFEKDYITLFGRAVEGMDIEITVWSVNATTPVEDVQQLELVSDEMQLDVLEHREMFDPALERIVQAQVVERSSINVANAINGPAAIVEDETTIIVPSSRRALMQADGSIDISLKSKSTSRPTVGAQNE